MTEDALVSVDVSVRASNRHGRAFLPLALLRGTTAETLGSLLSARFIEEDDAERLHLLDRALLHSTVTVETHPGEVPPHELHGYIVVPDISDTPIFACVLAPMALVRSLVTEPPYVVLETASFQVIDRDITDASIIFQRSNRGRVGSGPRFRCRLSD